MPSTAIQAQDQMSRTLTLVAVAAADIPIHISPAITSLLQV